MSNEREEFIRLTGASHEATEKLDTYAALLTEWNQKFNLVAPSTIEHIWTRHFLDSTQLLPLVPKTAETLADMGSGAGFPGMVLAIMGARNVHLIEGTGKKAEFLRMVADRLKLDVTIRQGRVEELKDFKADVITARALAPLNDLFLLANFLIKKDSLCLFLKGIKAKDELTESAKYWKFDCETIQSLSDSSGSILSVRNLHGPKRRK